MDTSYVERGIHIAPLTGQPSLVVDGPPGQGGRGSRSNSIDGGRRGSNPGVFHNAAPFAPRRSHPPWSVLELFVTQESCRSILFADPLFLITLSPTKKSWRQLYPNRRCCGLLLVWWNLSVYLCCMMTTDGRALPPQYTVPRSRQLTCLQLLLRITRLAQHHCQKSSRMGLLQWHCPHRPARSRAKGGVERAELPPH